MRIFIIGSSPGIGLLCNTARMALEMARVGHEVVVATYGIAEQSPGLAAELHAQGVRLEKVECLGKSGPAALCTDAAPLRKLIDAIAPDVIHVHGPVGAYQCRSQSAALRVAMIANMGHERRWPTAAAKFGDSFSTATLIW